MLTKAIFLVTALFAQSVFSSHYKGPTALPIVLHDGYLADAHEVAAAKSAHLTTLSRQSHGGGHYVQHGHDDLRYNGPTAIPHVLHDGHIADTHEVAAAKAEHYAAVAKAHDNAVYQHRGDYRSQYAAEYEHYSGASRASHGYDSHASYNGPIAQPVIQHDGHIADTHEVAAAKADHNAAVAKARAHGGDYNGKYTGDYFGYGNHASYYGTIAKPVVLPSGYLSDTHEVSNPKRHHLQALREASHHTNSFLYH